MKFSKGISKFFSVFVLLVTLFSSSPLPVFATISYSYDANGNMTSDGTRCYEYNDANQLSKVKNCASGLVIAEYVYDHTGKRVVKKEYKKGVVDSTTYTVSDSFETKIAKNGDRSDTTYYYVNNQLVARKTPEGKKEFYNNDHLGSVNVITDESGATVEKSSYYPFGETREGGEKSKYLFTGQEKDTETALYYYDSRYYNPQLKRFTQPDTMLPNPYDPQQINRYSYVRNNPLKYTDPSGHNPLLLLAAAAYVAIAPELPAITQEMYLNMNMITATISNAIADYQKNPSWGQGVLSGFDTLSVMPGVGLIGAGVKDVSMGSKVGEGMFKPFTSANFRSNLVELTGENPAFAQAHHVFPQKASLAEQFGKAGIDIHNPIYGSWWNSTPGLVGNHPSMASEYNKIWTDFFAPGAYRSQDQIFDFGRTLGEKYGFEIHY
jgi:RHS repeat-associated protein